MDGDLVGVMRRAERVLRERGTDAWLDECCTEDIVWAGLEEYRGRAAVAERMRFWVGAYDDWRFEYEEFTDCGNGVGFAVMRQWGTLHGMDTPIDQRQGQVIRFRDGKIASVVNDLDVEAAREAAAAAGR